MKERILIIGGVILMVLGLSVFAANAEEPSTGCATVEISWVDGTPLATAVDSDEGVRTAIVGSYLWLQHNSDGSADSLNNVVSVALTDETVITACMFEHDVTEPDIATAEPTIVETDEGPITFIVVGNFVIL